jgi:hypothetical protein
MESHSQRLTNEKVDDLAAQLTQKQQQQEQDPIVRSIEAYDLQEILARIDRHLQRLGNTDPD